ncbi:MAG: hypothetical protein HN348_04360 [Proteobacteria bacterium]|nr:hypothetical protein [Pseudomonadota bacterium]
MLTIKGKTAARGRPLLSYGEWEGKGAADSMARAIAEVQSIVGRGNTVPLSEEVERELDGIARRFAPDLLP